MVAQRGRDFLLKLDANKTGQFATVAGLRSRKIAFNAETVNVTTAESAGRWRELLAGAGVQRAAISAGGIFKDAASDAALRRIFFEGETGVFQIVIPDFGILEGPFLLTSLEYGGEHNGEVTFEIAMESAGPIHFAAIAP